jgi:DMSO/TMAO reductase YedYZ molybdopterin-dependent catalytic subunit
MTIELERRAFVQAGVALAAGAAVAAAVAPAAAQTAGPAPAAPKPMTFDVKPMPFDPTKINTKLSIGLIQEV